MKIEMTEEAKAARRDYKRGWNVKNRDHIREYTAEYWANKAKEIAVQREANEQKGEDKKDE